MMTRTLALLLLLACAPAWAQEPGLGRVFFSPEKRASLDRLRLQNAPTGRDADSGPLTYNGYVRRSTGREIQWVNGVPQEAAGAGRQPLRVGETLDPGSGEKQDLLKGGRIGIGSPGQRPSP